MENASWIGGVSLDRDEVYSSSPEGSETGWDDAADGKQRLLHCLLDVQTEGNFSAFYHAHIYPNPGLSIGDRELIGLPLSENDAALIASECKQAPFGRKDETVVDTSVRRTWELDGSQIKFQNPFWKIFVKQLADRALKDLGVSVPAHAELYKLLLYEEGAFFKPHKDSEKARGMFGTMVVCLPSRHEGGDVWLSHAGEERTLATATTSYFDLTMLSWYADVTHEVKPLTAGYRLVLTYNLVQDSLAEKQTASLLSTNRLRLQQSLQHCSIASFDTSCFAYIFDHRYTEASLRLEGLKGRDAAVGLYLNKVCFGCEFYLFLANLTATIREEDDYYGDSDDRDTITLTHIVTPAGATVASHVEIERDSILNDGPFDGDCNSEDEGEFTGNESMPSEFRYHRTVALLVRKHKFEDVIGLRETHCQEVVDFIVQNLETNAESGTDKYVAFGILKKIMSLVENECLEGNRNMYNNFFSPYSSIKPPSERLSELIPLLGKLAKLLKHEHILQNLFARIKMDHTWPDFLFKSIAEKMFPSQAVDVNKLDITAWEQWLAATRDNATTVAGLYNLAHVFVKLASNLPEGAEYDSFRIWTSKTISACCDTVVTFGMKDSQALVHLLEFDCSLWDRMQPLLTSCGQRDAVLDLLLRLPNSRIESGTSNEIFLAILSLQAEHLCPRVIPNPAARPSALPFNVSWPRYDDGEKPLMWPVEHSNQYLTLLGHVLRTVDNSIALRMIKSMDFELPAEKGKSYFFWCREHSAVMDFTVRFAQLLKEFDDDSLVDAGRPIIMATLLRHASFVSKNQPKRPVDWTRVGDMRSNCSCGSCTQLRSFMSSPTMTEISFTANKAVRQHVERSFDSQWYEMRTNGYRGGRPHTLIVTKTNRKHEDDLVDWPKRYKMYRNNVRKLQDPFFKGVLGAELYQRLVLLDPLLVFREPSQSIAPDSRDPQVEQRSVYTGQALQPIAGQKRKAEVIDLLSDD